MSDIFLSVVMPAYNEEKKIREALRRVEAFLAHKSYHWELLVVNDGSQDGTEKIINECIRENQNSRTRLLNSPVNKGKGASVKMGVLEARGERVLVTDADLSSPIKEVDKLMRVLDQGFDGVIGSRAIREEGCDVQQSFKRWVSGRVFNFFVRAVALRGFRDTQCGFKCFTHQAARLLFGKQTLEGFAFDVEILCLARAHGCKIKEVPVMWKEGRDSRVNLFKDSISMLGDLFVLRKRYGRS